MIDFTEVVKWDDSDKLKANILYGLRTPTLENISVAREGLTIPSSSANKFGRATYRYDFGRDGITTALRFDGTIFTKFRLKAADSANTLSSTLFDGTDRDKFLGTTIDTVKYAVDPNSYNVDQSNAINITGDQTAPGVFEDPATLSLNTPLSDTYTVRTSMRLITNRNNPHDSGSFSFLRLDNGTNSIEVQKYEAQIRTNVVDAYGNDLGRDVDSNDIILGEPTEILVDGIFSENAPKLTDGTLGIINDVISDPELVEELLDLKVIEELTDYVGRTSLQSDCVRILGLRADYSLTGILADLQRGLFYRPKDAHGYTALRVPFVNATADLFSNDIKSYNLVNGRYEFAEVNDVWSTTILVPQGIHFYRFIVDGEPRVDSANPVTTLASGDFNVITAENTQFVEFIFEGKAEDVSLVASFEEFQEIPMNVGFDAAQILKINSGDTYHNNHSDWHKIEVEFDKPIPVIAVRFVTDVPFDYNQRVRILLDDHTITRDEWTISCMPEDLSDEGISECATYSNLLAGNFEDECLTAFVNNTDTITAAEDGLIEWTLTSDPINDRAPKFVKKFAFLTRLENGSITMRSHRRLEVVLSTDGVTRSTDYRISNSTLDFRSLREGQVGLSGDWCINQTVLQGGTNSIMPIQIQGEDATYGNPVSVFQNGIRSFVETLNQSGVALNNVEVACTLAANLSQEVVNVVEVVDLGGSASVIPPDQRFTRESFTLANDRLRVVVINIGIEPEGTYYLHLVGQPANFLLELYETEEEAINRTNRIGFAESSGYGFQVIPVFTAERQIDTATGLEDVIVVNVIVCFDETASDAVFITRPRANI